MDPIFGDGPKETERIDPLCGIPMVPVSPYVTKDDNGDDGVVLLSAVPSCLHRLAELVFPVGEGGDRKIDPSDAEVRSGPSMRTESRVQTDSLPTITAFTTPS